MRIVPSVVVHESRPVGHSGYLIPVIPPRHDASIFVCILPQPVVGLSEVVEDVTAAVYEVKKTTLVRTYFLGEHEIRLS
jgi:hypothetical protein